MNREENLRKGLVEPFYVARDGYGILSIYKEKPIKSITNDIVFWKGKGMFIDKTLFPEVKENYLYIETIKDKNINECDFFKCFRGYNHVAKNKDNTLYIFEDKPLRFPKYWGACFGLRIESFLCKNMKYTNTKPIHIVVKELNQNIIQ